MSQPDDAGRLPGGGTVWGYVGTVTVGVPPLSDRNKQRFFESMAAFEEATGIQVNCIGGKEFEARLEAGANSAFDPAGPGLLNIGRQWTKQQ